MIRLEELLQGEMCVAIGGHIRPDGDCVGSTLGLYQYIKKQFPHVKVDIYLEDIPDKFRFLVASEEIKTEVPEGKVYDLFFCLDCGDSKRLGFSEILYHSAKETVCVDHHISNESYATYNYIEPQASSTSELIYHLMKPEKISKDIATCLYLGIVHDTGVFQYSCTSPSTMRAAAHLMETGVDTSRLIEETYYEKTYLQNQILGRTLLESMLLLDGRCIAAMITRKMMDFYEVTPKDMDGIVSQMRNTKGVDVAMFVYELEPQEFKVSLRSNDNLDSSRIAQFFGGGGHKKAAGFTIRGSAHDAITNVLAKIHQQFEEEA